jgi:glucose/mannose-6-phosphate isomerase
MFFRFEIPIRPFENQNLRNLSEVKSEKKKQPTPALSVGKACEKFADGGEVNNDSMLMKTLIASFPEQLAEALSNAQSFSFKSAISPVKQVLIIGLGGSGIGGSIVQSIAYYCANVPLLVSKNYDIPAFTDANTLVIASSFSGNTEETLAALEKAVLVGAQVCCITSGGKLKRTAEEKGFDCITLPVKAECPRAHIAYSLVALLVYLTKKNILPDYASEISLSAKKLSETQNFIQEESKRIAAKLFGKLPLLYADDVLHAVLVRFQQQINENAKQLCHVNVFPEMNHNELVGWVKPENILKNSVVLLFESMADHPRVRIRMDVCEPIFSAHCEVLRIKAKGDSILEQMLFLIHLTDWVSYDLALLNDIDPFPVEIITHLKSELSKH